MDIKQLRNLFGSNDINGVYKFEDALRIHMNIITDYGWNIDPQYTKDLYLYLNIDSMVTSFEVTEHYSE